MYQRSFCRVERYRRAGVEEVNGFLRRKKEECDAVSDADEG
jgi:hypothetical protein